MRTRQILHRWGMVAALIVAMAGQIASVPATFAAAQVDVPPAEYPPLAASPEFVEAECDFEKDDLPASLKAADNVTCGTVAVPQDHENPEGDTIEIFVVKVASTGKNPSPTPFLLLAGGPGQAGSDVLAIFDDDTWGTYASWTTLLEDRDAYLIDQRGTGRTEPAVICPADRGAQSDSSFDDEAAAPGADDEETAVTAADYYGDCAATLLDEGIDLQTYTNRQSAADLDVVRQAIGARRVDLIGISYGTWLALEMMRYYPDSIRSVVLSSPVPPQSRFFDGSMFGFQDSLNAVYEGCAADPQCDAAFPDLERTFQKTIRKLDAKPMSLTFEDPTTGEETTADATGQDLMSLVFQLMYSGPAVSFIPSLIGSVAAGDDELFALLVPALISASDGIGTALHYAVICQDELPFVDVDEVFADAEQAGISQQVIDDERVSVENYVGLCDAWDLPPSSEIENEPVESNIPTLILTGKFDPITPTSGGEEALKTLPNGILIESPVAGHDPLSTSGTCGMDVTRAFLNTPRAELDTSCFDDLTMDFSPT